MNKAQILSEANKVLNTEIKSIKTISSSFDNNFYNVLNNTSYFFK